MERLFFCGHTKDTSPLYTQVIKMNSYGKSGIGEVHSYEELHGSKSTCRGTLSFYAAGMTADEIFDIMGHVDMSKFVDTVSEIGKETPVCLLFSAVNDKDYHEMIREIQHLKNLSFRVPLTDPIHVV